MFAQGVGVARNCKQAIGWAHKAAEAGSPAAALLLGELNIADCDGSKNPREAARWFRVAADKGMANAQFSLGVLYMTGEGVPKDLKEARKWFTAAASKGNTTAQFYLRRLDNLELLFSLSIDSSASIAGSSTKTLGLFEFLAKAHK